MGCWARRTKLEKTLLALFLLLFIAVIVLLVFIIGDHYLNNGKELCTSKECVQAAASIQAALNLSVDPCEDFFEYACGQWKHDHPIPDDKSSFVSTNVLEEKIRQQTRMLLESDVKTNSKTIDMVKQAYKSCMNTTVLEQQKSDPLLAILKKLGYWPMLDGDKWQQKDFNLTELLGQMRKLTATTVFFYVNVYADTKNTSRNVLYIDQDELGLGWGSREYYLNDMVYSDQIQAYRNYLSNVVDLLLTDINDKGNSKQLLETDIFNIINFEKSLAEIIVSESDRTNKTAQYNIRQIKDMYSILPEISWEAFLRITMPQNVQNCITFETEIILREIGYLKKLSKLLSDTNHRTIVNYIFWRFTLEWSTYLDSRFENLNQGFQSVISGRQQKLPRWEQCIDFLTNNLHMASGALYVRNHFDVSEKQEALEMVANLQESFFPLIDKSDWIDEQTKKRAIEKVAAMNNLVGYPDFLKNDTALDKYHEELDLKQTDNYFDSARKINVWYQERYLSNLPKPFDKFHFGDSPAIVDAFYYQEQTLIFIPAGHLQSPFFSGAFPKAINYGAIGSIIGHEIMHGFDDYGRELDKDGNLNKWWSQTAAEQFSNRTQCFIDQYSAFRVPDIDLNVNGTLTQGENIADNAGLKASYMAYRKFVEKLGHEEPRLPGLNSFTGNQIFFLSFAHNKCGHMKPAAVIQHVLGDSHSPYQFRVTGVVANMQEFATAFNCSKNSRMNPEKRCVVW